MSEKKPLRLADGSLVYPNGRVVPPGGQEPEPKIVAVPTHDEARQLVVSTRRKLSDLPDVPRTMNPISVVLSYTLFGLDNEEIALATNLRVSQVATIKMSDAYRSMHDTVVATVLGAESDDIRTLFTQHARSAAHEMASMLKSPAAAIRMAAAKDILDRGGFRPSDVVEHRHSMAGGLTIEVVRKDEREMPTIDMEPS